MSVGYTGHDDRISIAALERLTDFVHHSFRLGDFYVGSGLDFDVLFGHFGDMEGSDRWVF